ncbi:MAG: acyl-CoA synthetase [Janthinobacterium lividum]
MHPRFHAERSPDRAAAIMSDTGETLTYGDLESVANAGAHLLRGLGIENGDTIAIWLPNTLRYFEIYWAAQRAGLYIAPISTALTAEEAAYILGDCGAKLLVTSARVGAAADLLANYRDGLPVVRNIFWVDEELSGAVSWHAARSSEPATPIADEQAGFHMVYSSGTTGRPKGVRLPLTGGPATAEHDLAIRQRTTYGVGEGTVFLSPAPLYHTAPLAFTTTAQRLGATTVILPKFDPEAALRAIERFHVSFTQMVPTMFIRLLRLPAETRARYDLSSLRTVLHAAAPCPVEVKHRMIEWLGPIIEEYYGGSEGNGATYITSAEWLRKPGSVGRASWGVIHVCDEAGLELPAGEPGLIYFEGGWDFEYLNDPGKTRDARNALHPSWSTLGDIGYVDSDGYLFLTDRKSFMIISGGVNIYPQEVENLLSVHPKVADAAVIGIPDAEMGESVKAIVQPLDWADATPAFAEELIAYCRQHVAGFKVPRSIDFDRELPRHDTGKLYKRLIRDRYWGDNTKRIA